jgi:hypothetical protein
LAPALGDLAERRHVGPQRRAPAVVLEADEQPLLDAYRQLAHRSHGPAAGNHVDEAEPGVLVVALDAKGPPEDLQAGADRDDVGAVADPRDERRVAQQVHRQSLRSVLASPEEVERGIGQLVTESHVGQFDLVAATSGPLGDHQAIAPVTVGAQQFGKEDGDLQHGLDLASQSLKAV